MINLLRNLLPKLLGRLPAPPTAAPGESIQIEAAFRDVDLGGWFRKESSELLDGFPIYAEDHVLDIGCGDGAHIRFCAQLGAEVTFADIDAEKIRQVEAQLQGSSARAIHPLVTDANPLPLPDACADKVIALEVMEHVDEPAQFLQELVRVGKPGALYLLSVPGTVSEGVQKLLAPPVNFQKPNHIHIFTPDDFARLTIESGLSIEKKINYGFYWSIWWAFFWSCKRDLSSPQHPLLDSWANTWVTLLEMPEGRQIKSALDGIMPKNQIIIARKPA